MQSVTKNECQLRYLENVFFVFLSILRAIFSHLTSFDSILYSVLL